MAPDRPELFDDRIAGIYDEWHPRAEESAISALCALAQGGRALELGIGSGRFALPLQACGVQVWGIDASSAMLARLRAKPGAEHIHLTEGDFADVPVEGQFSLIYVVFNTLFDLLTQEAQVRCFQNVARHLTPAGAFVVEAFVPDLARYQGGQSVRAIDAGSSEVRIDVSQLDPVSQQVTSRHVALSEDGIRIFPVQLRYAWPSELDLMAQLAGMRRKHRWSSWDRAAFTAHSTSHISVYELAG